MQWQGLFERDLGGGGETIFPGAWTRDVQTQLQVIKSPQMAEIRSDLLRVRLTPKLRSKLWLCRKATLF